MGFAPKYNPKIAIAIFVENAGFGGDVAAPLGSLMIEKYLNGEIVFYRQWLQRKLVAMDLVNKSPIVPGKKQKQSKQDSLSMKTDTTSFMIISCIVAFDNNRVIGVDNKMPWHIPEI